MVVHLGLLPSISTGIIMAGSSGHTCDGGQKEDGILQRGDAVAVVRQRGNVTCRQLIRILSRDSNPSRQHLHAGCRWRIVFGQLGSGCQSHHGLPQRAVMHHKLSCPAVARRPCLLQKVLSSVLQRVHGSSLQRGGKPALTCIKFSHQGGQGSAVRATGSAELLGDFHDLEAGTLWVLHGGKATPRGVRGTIQQGTTQ